MTDSAEQESLVQLFREKAPEQEVENEEAVSRNRQEIGLESPVTGIFEDEREVLVHRDRRQQPAEADEVDWEHMVVRDAVPETFEVDGLTGASALASIAPEWAAVEDLPVVHIAFARVITEDAVDHYLLFVPDHEG